MGLLGFLHCPANGLDVCATSRRDPYEEYPPNVVDDRGLVLFSVECVENETRQNVSACGPTSNTAQNVSFAKHTSK